MMTFPSPTPQPSPLRPLVAALLCLVAACAAPASEPDATDPDAADPDAADTDAADTDTDAADADAAEHDSANPDAGEQSSADHDADDPDAADQDASGPDAPAPDTAGCQSHADCPQPAEPCRLAICSAEGACVTIATVDAAICDDDDACTLGDLCQKGLCQPGGAKDCADSDPCTIDSCDSAKGCLQLPAAVTPCNDGLACSAGDHCEAGVCVPGTNVCACQTDADCKSKDDGDLCNGTLYCEPASHACVVNPATVVVCNTASDGPCAATTCAPAKGSCQKAALPLDTPCDDGLACTTGDHCAAGACTPGTKTCCDQDADCADDGDLCNGTAFCNIAKGLCQLNPLTVVSCQTAGDTACSQTSCVPSTGKCTAKAAAPDVACDDGDSCTAGDHCQGGACQGGTAACACKADVDCQAQEDGDLCNGTLYCDKVSHTCKVNAATVITCPSVDDTACTAASCVAKTGTCAIVPRPDGTACDADASACTPKDACKAGACTADTNVCPCQQDADCKPKDDADLCNGTLYCDKLSNACKINPATVVFCPEPVGGAASCLANLCQSTTGTCVLLPGQQGGVCDADGNPCTAVDTCDKGACVAAANTCECQQDADCKAKEDGDLCNGTLFCDKSTKRCAVNAATVIACSAVFDTECQRNLCQPKTGSCKPTAVRELQHCDADGNACTLYDVCQAGSCTPGQNLCACGVDDHCKPVEDGDACNGKLLCGGEAGKKRCLVNQATVVSCPLGDLQGCTTSECQPGDGSCKVVPWPEGKPCADADPCSEATVCAQGQCGGGVGKACDDNNPCTDDACAKGKGCVALPNSATCVDGDVCTTGDLCKAGVCKPGVANAKACDDGNPCTEDSCQPASGCLHASALGSCDDGNACTSGDACSAGSCKGGLPPACNDGNPCTKDACDPQLGCVAAPLQAACDDGNACTVNDACSAGACAGSAKGCDDGDACTGDSCNVANGQCQHAAKVCSDGDVCTDDACQAKLGCLHSHNLAPCDDGDACTAKDGCQGGLCKPGAAALCDDGNLCTDDGCAPKSGCTAKARTGPCDDGVACTQADACQGGVCIGKVDCGDGVACTLDACDAKTGSCSHAAKDALCDDGEVCTDDGCHGKLGCQHVANQAACNDGDACTAGDVCSGGACKPQKGKVCDDGDPCTKDGCDAKTGCTAAPLTHSVSAPALCDDGVACTKGDVCQQGLCKGTVQCDDANACTADGCDAKTAACAHVAVSGACDDGDACTAGEACGGGACKAAKVVVCDDGDVCTDDLCDTKKGCLAAPNTAPCDLGACTVGDTCSAGTCLAGKDDRIFERVLVKAGSGELPRDAVWLPGGDLLWVGQLAGSGQYGPVTLAGAVRLKPDGALQWATGFAYVGGSYAWRVLARKDGSHQALLKYGQCMAIGAIGLDGKLGVPGYIAYANCNASGGANGSQVPAALRERVLGGKAERIVFATRDEYGRGELVLALDAAGAVSLGYQRYTEWVHQTVEDGIVEADGSVTFVGTTNEAAGSLGGYDFTLVRLDAKLAPLQRYRYGGKSDDVARVLVKYPDGGWAFVGRATGTGTIGGADSWLWRIDANGKALWEQRYGHGGDDEVRALRLRADGTLVAAEYSRPSGTGDWDPSLRAFTASGDALWWRSHGKPSRYDDVWALLPHPSGDLYALGSDYANVNDVVSADTLLLRTDGSGFVSCKVASQCATYSLKGCDDGDVCTADWCSSSYGCKASVHQGVCTDGDACTAVDLCDSKAKCQPGSPVGCDDGNPCTSETCDKAKGCVVVVISDGASCGAGKACKAGACVGG